MRPIWLPLALGALALSVSLALAAGNPHFTRGMELLRAGNFTGAARELTLASEEDPNSPGIYLNLGIAKAQLGDDAGAERAFRKAGKLAPSSTAAHYNLALSLLKLGRSREGIEELKQADRLSPGNADIQYNLGTALVDSGDANQAVTFLEPLVSRGGAPEASVQLARAYADLGLMDRALALIGRLPSDVRRSPEMLLLQARLLQKSGKPEEALPLLADAAKLDPKSAEIPYSAAFSDYVLDKHEEARKELEKSLRNDPRMDRAYFLLSIVNLTTGDFKAAQIALHRAMELRPRNPFYLCIYGMTLERDNNAKAAAETFRAVIGLAPNYALAHYQLGKLLATEGKNAEAIAELERAMRIEPDMTEALYHLGRAYKAVGRDADARTALSRFQELRRSETSERDDLLQTMRRGIQGPEPPESAGETRK